MTTSGDHILSLKGEWTRGKTIASVILALYPFKMQIHLSDLLILKAHDLPVLRVRLEHVQSLYGSSSDPVQHSKIKPI
jgi:hypothetical protein